MEADRWYTTQEIVAMLGVHEQTVRSWIKSGQLRGVLLSRKSGFRVRGEDLAAFLEARVVDEGKAAA